MLLTSISRVATLLSNNNVLYIIIMSSINAFFVYHAQQCLFS